jgi:hypothetical protein
MNNHNRLCFNSDIHPEIPNMASKATMTSKATLEEEFGMDREYMKKQKIRAEIETRFSFRLCKNLDQAIDIALRAVSYACREEHSEWEGFMIEVIERQIAWFQQTNTLMSERAGRKILSDTFRYMNHYGLPEGWIKWTAMTLIYGFFNKKRPSEFTREA